MPGQYTSSDVQRFWSHVDRSGDCWIWTASRFRLRGNYGIFCLNYRNLRAHRVAYELAYGPIPEGAYVLHHCDNPPCVRPDHLYLGDQFDNMRDMASRDRHIWGSGEDNPNARLTMEDAREIRRLYRRGGVTQAEIGKQFGVSQSTIGRVVSGKRYKESS